MIRDNQKYFNRLLVLLDAIVIAVSYIVSWYVYLSGEVIELPPETGILEKEIYFAALIAIIPGYLILYSTFDMYSSKRVSKSRSEFFNIVKENTVGILALLVVMH